MRKLRIIKIIVIAIVALMFTTAFHLVQLVDSQAPLGTIFINADGTIFPDTARIQRSGNTYTFTDNIYAAVKILKSDIVLNGAGYTLSGPYNGTASDIWIIGNGPDKNTLAQYVIGVDLSNSSVNGITIENLNVKNFSIGMYVWTKNNTVIGNGVSNNIVGILLSGSNATVTGNYIASNIRGLFFGFTSGSIPSDLYIYNNDFEKNSIQMNGCTCKLLNSSEPIHYWDFGQIGNYWSDYNGTSSIHEAIGNTPYIIDLLNQDRYPLMQSPVKPPVPSSNSTILDYEIILIVAIPVVLVVASAIFVSRKKKQQTSKN
jgi:parallel beta-helix repeat protein